MPHSQRIEGRSRRTLRRSIIFISSVKSSELILRGT